MSLVKPVFRICGLCLTVRRLGYGGGQANNTLSQSFSLSPIDNGLVVPILSLVPKFVILEAFALTVHHTSLGVSF